MTNKQTQQIGKYTVTYDVGKDPTQGCRVSWYIDDKHYRSIQIPSDDEIRSKFNAEMQSERGKPSHYTMKKLCVRSLIVGGPNNYRKGMDELGLSIESKGYFHVRLDEATSDVLSFWPPELVRNVALGEENVPPDKKLANFKLDHLKIYSFAGRSGVGLAEIVRQAHPEYGAEFFRIISLRKKVTNVDVKDTRSLLLERYDNGLPISCSAILASSSDSVRSLWGRVCRVGMQLAANRDDDKSKVIGNRDYTSWAEYLTGIPRSDFEMGTDGSKIYGAFSEKLIEFLLRWSRVTNYNLSGVNKGKIYAGFGDTKFCYASDFCRIKSSSILHIF